MPDLKYANCWEDADLLLDRIGDIRGGRVLSISSGGENSLSLLSRSPELLAVVDMDPGQLATFELKKVAVELLEWEDFLAFLGYTDTADRADTYRGVRDRLSQEARGYWDTKSGWIRAGFIHSGRVARRLRLISRFIRPLIHDARRSRELMKEKGSDEQARFYRDVWDNRRWRTMVRVLFGKPAIYLVSPEPEFFKYFKGGVAEHLLDKSARHLSTVAAQGNHMLHYFLFGHFGELIPHFAREENFQAIKANLGAVVRHEGRVETAISPYGKFDAFNLSNIFEYTTPDSFRVLAKALEAGANPSARFAYWNIVLPRRLSEVAPHVFESCLDTDLDRTVPDKGWIYYRFLVDRRKEDA